MISPQAIVLAAAAAILMLWMVDARAGMNVCVDKNGKKTFQQSACPQVNSGIEPVSAETLTQENILLALKRLDEIMVRRDLRAFERFLTADFRNRTLVVNQDGSERLVADLRRSQALAGAAAAFRSPASFSNVRGKCAITIEKGVGTSVCKIKHTVSSGQGSVDLENTEVSEAVVEDGVIRFRLSEDHVVD